MHNQSLYGAQMGMSVPGQAQHPSLLREGRPHWEGVHSAPLESFNSNHRVTMSGHLSVSCRKDFATEQVSAQARGWAKEITPAKEFVNRKTSLTTDSEPPERLFRFLYSMVTIWWQVESGLYS